MRYEKYKTDGWRWRYIVNARIISQSSEAYLKEADCDRSIELNKNSGGAPVDRK